jgi:isopentenyl-diphosphate Delta-isomerase
VMEEYFDIVSDDDEVVGLATRKDVHTKGFVHRSVVFFIFDVEGRIFVNQRTDTKEFYPGYWSIVFGGHVRAGEDYDDTVGREAEEEAGVTSQPFFMASFKKRFDDLDRENVRVYGFVADREPVLERTEIKQGAFLTLAELERKIGEEKFLPETARLSEILKNYLRSRSH